MSDDIKAPEPKPHKHYFSNAVQIKNAFEPLPAVNDVVTFKLIEYAYMGCNCGQVIKSKVKPESEYHA